MNSIIFVTLSIFVCAQAQIFAPAYQRTIPGCPCGNPALSQVLTVPYEIPCGLPVPAPIPKPVTKPPCACESALPVGLPFGNPFLPAASPVSALAPFSPYLPPANTCSRCQYLKKIPIPPPCI